VFTSDLLRLANVLSQFWRVGLDMLAPLFTGGGLEAQVKMARYLEAVLAQDTEAVRLSRQRYVAGATDLLHVLQLQAKQISTRCDLIGIDNQRLANRVGLHLALGGGFEPPPTP
jgi:outer membrane protein TolC